MFQRGSAVVETSVGDQAGLACTHSRRRAQQPIERKLSDAGGGDGTAALRETLLAMSAGPDANGPPEREPRHGPLRPDRACPEHGPQLQHGEAEPWAA